MNSYRLVRDDRSWYEGRMPYLAGRSRIPVGEPSFCHAIEFASAQAKGEHPPSVLKRREVREWDGTEAWRNFPWVTPMLGSGCLELRDQYEFTAESVAAGVEQRLLDLFADQLPPRGEHPATLARTFTRNLVAARLPHDDHGAPATDGVTVDPLAARVTLLAARLTVLYHWANAGALACMSRWDDDVARLDPDRAKRPRELLDIDELVLQPLRRERAAAVLEIERASKASSGKGVKTIYESVATLLKAIGDNLGVEEELGRDILVSRGHVRVLTEVAWFLLVRHSTVYPGWTESLLRLTLHYNSPQARAQRRMSPLLNDLTEMDQSVRLFMEPATKGSWDRLHGPDEQPSARNRLYRSCADLLYAQQAAAERWQREGAKKDRDRRLPTPSAYVTSFDLELEMAMWQEGCRRLEEASKKGADDVADGLTFSVVIPVHVLEEHGDEAEFCWLRADITPDRGTTELDALRRPHRWRVARDEDELPEQPVIVHLNGAPLFHLPEFVHEVEGLAGDLEPLEVIPRADERGERKYRLVHAVTVDEYLARRQSERELTWLSMGGSDNSKRYVPRALPSNLQRDNHSRRFWMVLGVPIADPAVRTRVMAHLIPRPNAIGPGRSAPSPDPYSSNPGWTADRDGVVGSSASLFADDEEPELLVPDPPANGTRRTDGAQEPELADAQRDPKPAVAPGAAMGVAVNRRIDNDEASLLYWLGLDVVRTDVHDFVVDLEHYTAHLRHDHAPAPAAYDKVCPVSLKESP